MNSLWLPQHVSSTLKRSSVCRTAYSLPATRVPRSPSAQRRSCMHGGAMQTTTLPATSSRTLMSSTSMPWLALGSPGQKRKLRQRQRLFGLQATSSSSQVSAFATLALSARLWSMVMMSALTFLEKMQALWHRSFGRLTCRGLPTYHHTA